MQCKNGNADLFYHARANYYSKNKKAAEALSHFRENVMKCRRRDPEDRWATHLANDWGRSGGNPRKYEVKRMTQKHLNEFPPFAK